MNILNKWGVHAFTHGVTTLQGRLHVFSAPWRRCSSSQNAVCVVVSPSQEAEKPYTRPCPTAVSRITARSRSCLGFTLLEVLVALVIVGTALGASLRAVGSLTRNSDGLRVSMMATWSAENRLTQIRLAGEFPDIGERSFDCPQGDLHLVCRETVLSTPNPLFHQVMVSVADAQAPDRRIVKLNQLVPR